jgi:hypothetical protein
MSHLGLEDGKASHTFFEGVRRACALLSLTVHDEMGQPLTQAELLEICLSTERVIDGSPGKSPHVPTLGDLSTRLLALSQIMDDLSVDMEYVGGFGPLAVHALGLRRAAGIARTWAQGLQRLTKEDAHG